MGGLLDQFIDPIRTGYLMPRYEDGSPQLSPWMPEYRVIQKQFTPAEWNAMPEGQQEAIIQGLQSRHAMQWRASRGTAVTLGQNGMEILANKPDSPFRYSDLTGLFGSPLEPTDANLEAHERRFGSGPVKVRRSNNPTPGVPTETPLEKGPLPGSRPIAAARGPFRPPTREQRRRRGR